MRHRLDVVLALAAAGVLAGCRTLLAVWEHMADLDPGDLAELGIKEGRPLPSAVHYPPRPASPGPR